MTPRQTIAVILLAGCLFPGRSAPLPEDAAARGLADEVRERGWIAYSARSEAGDWDVFVMRPDGSARRNLTGTREFNEGGARFSPDGARLLYYRMPRGEAMDNNKYGTYDLVIAQADGMEPVVFGPGFSWASWSPDGTQIACLSPAGIRLIEVASRRVVRTLNRKGIVEQLVWSPDGRWLIGTANGLGPYWNIGRVSVETGEINAVSEVERYNCTSDWLPDSRGVVYARGIVPQVDGRAELWVANADGAERRTLYAEAGRHIYGGCASPDGKYVLFTRSVDDLGKVDHERTTMALIRWSDTPMIGDSSEPLRQRLPNARSGPRLDLGQGWEPHWIGGKVRSSTGDKTK